ncbi:MAG TPA: LysM peptidoglycan-binding domain-containing protein [Polyangiaceae bacterium]|nr:LysM peptidoglycan-binding domain-containing protein [Polyangiaceae bacterium]
MGLTRSTSIVFLLLALCPSAAGAREAAQPMGPLDPGDAAWAKKQPKAPARSAAPKKNRSNKPQQPPAPAVRRATAGPGAEPPPSPEPPELQALRQAERELFGTDDLLVPSDGCPPELLPDASNTLVFSTGLPPSSVAPRAQNTSPQPDYLSSLRMPDVPVKFTSRVVQYLDFYKNDSRGRAVVAIFYRKSGRFEPMLRSVLRHHGLPEDLMWVAVVESGLNPTIYSPVGAAGLWQFMPESGRLYGLVIDRWVDERLDPVRSTHAAAMYLQDLYRRFGTWELALGSYNMGYGGMLAALRKYNTNDFWELSRFEAGVPWETALYVPKILALAVVGKNPEVFGLANLTRDPPAEFDEVDVVPGVSLESVAKAAEVDVSDIGQLNPQLLASRIPPRAPTRAAAGVWTVRVPKGHGAKVEANLVQTRVAEPELVPYTVRHGESLADIAAAHGTTTQELSRHNALTSDEPIRPGLLLMVPPRRRASPTTEKIAVAVPVDLQPPAGYQRRFYQAVAGDTLQGVANALSVRVDDLIRWNGLDVRARLHPGMLLLTLLPATQTLSRVRLLSDDDVQVFVVGSDAFFDYHEAQKGRVRMVTVVQSGETWRSIAARTGLSLGMLERINQRSRSTPLQEGEKLVVYVPASKVAAQPKPAPQAKDPELSTPEPSESVSEDMPLVPPQDTQDSDTSVSAEPSEPLEVDSK